jgi:hypothetical protein
LFEGIGGQGDGIGVVGVVGDEAEGAAAFEGEDAPFFRGVRGAGEAEAGEDGIGVKLLVDWLEAVVADDDEVNLVVGFGGLYRLADGADEAVNVFKGGEGFG